MRKALAGARWGLLFGALLAVSAPRVAAADSALDPALRTRIVDTVATRVSSAYVLPELAQQMEAALRAHAASHDYDSARTTEELCRRLTTDLRQVSGDLHLEVTYREKAGPKTASALNGVGRTAGDQTLAAKLSNFGFETASRLAGNVGYLDLREFYDAEIGYRTAAAAMAFLSQTDALVIDLRENLGGAINMNALLSTYLLGRKLIHLNGVRGRQPGETGELWTVPQAPQSIYAKEVYLLTSHQTFSQAEAFAYQLQQLHRVTLVGERTAGGAHLVEYEPIADHVVLRLPKGRFVHPVTQTNWQGAGVTPDVETSAADALARAHLLALTNLQRRNTNPDLSSTYERLVKRAQQVLDEGRQPVRAGSK